MADCVVIYWRDIPAQVVVRAGRRTAKRELPPRFQEAIDIAAMRGGAKDSDAYLAAWRRSPPEPCDDDLDAAADAAVARLVGAFPDDQLMRLARAGGDRSQLIEEPLVFFAPSGKRGRVAVGTSVLDAARRFGVDLDSVCGGRGLCGRCQIRVEEGHYASLGITSSAEHLPPWTAGEAAYTSRRGPLAEGRRLGCQCTISGDLVIDVPADAQVHRQVVRKAADERTVAVDPVVSLRVVDVAEPDMHDARSDARRLAEALAAEWSIDIAPLDLAVLRTLQATLRQGGWRVTVAVRHRAQVVAVYPGVQHRIVGLAVDLGSTTIAGHLCDLATGAVLASAGVMNPQIRFGDDLMSRVSYVMMNPDATATLATAARGAIDQLARDLLAEVGASKDELVEFTIVGNPVMHHLLLGVSPVELGGAPFALADDGPIDLPAAALDLTAAAGAMVHLLPCIAGHVGADAAAMILAEAPHLDATPTLLIDVGTNAELVLGSTERVLAASSPTGPAFEGAQISGGQRAAPGAIERVRIDADTLEPRIKVIGDPRWSDEPGFDARVTGICGSGIIEAVAELYRVGIIASDGTIEGAFAERTPRVEQDQRTFGYRLWAGTPVITITQGDVRAIQLAKAALHAGAKLLMARWGLRAITRIKLAGAFGSHIDPLYALMLGLIPDCPLAGVTSVGNAAGHGARIALVNAAARTDIAALVRRIEKVETAVEPSFQAEFVAAMALPHATDDYALLRAVVALPAPAALKRRVRQGGNRNRL